MAKTVRDLEPRNMWNHFADLNAVPRPSKHEARVIEFIKDFGKKLGLPTVEDHVGNVIIKKPASPGMEDRQTVVLQSHLDMVHQKNADTTFDFATQGIDMYVDGDWVRARGTTLGADNGIGVASIMAILSSDEIVHPPIEALFTIDEETGMTGAQGLKGGMLDATIMLNLDTEDDDELTIGCAGGVDVTARGTYQEESVQGQQAFRLVLNGLTGGHSGMDIHRGRGNANKLMNRVLWKCREHYGAALAALDGGSLRNAIPRESVATVVLPAEKEVAFKSYIHEISATLKAEHLVTDPDLKLELHKTDLPTKVMSASAQNQLVGALYASISGIYRMSPDIEGLVQTSNNLARVEVKNGSYTIMCLTRSAVDSEKMDLAQSLQAAFEGMGADVHFDGAYPGWTPRPEASIVSLMQALYVEMFKEQPKVAACHAGLECGILGTHYPAMEMISFGPNIRGAHSPDECTQISSVQKYWGFLMETLKRIPKK